MTLTEELLTILTSYHRGYRLMRAGIHGVDIRSLPSQFKKLSRASDNTLRATLSRLKKNGLIHNNHERGVWNITEKGRGRLAIIRHTLFPKSPTHSQRSKIKKLKNMIVAFDIPEKQKRKRDWLRIELTNLGFEMLQQSVWFGAAPLPAQFIESLEELKIISHIKFFEVKEANIV